MTDDAPESDGGDGGESDEPLRDRRIPERVVSLDDVFDVLGNSRRRHVLYAFQERSEWSVDDLARRIAARETDSSEAAVDETDRRRVHTSLHHVHIPLLREHDVVTYDAASKHVRPGGSADRMLAALEGVGAYLDSGSTDTDGER